MAEIITYAAASGMKAAMMEITNRTNNLANVNSLGYQAMEIETKDTFYHQLTKAGIQESRDVGERPVGVQLGTGVKVTGTYRNLSEGTIKQTSNPLDIAIIGSGYFAVTLPNNQRAYTRGGAFQVNNQRQLVTSEGYALVDDITIPGNVQISTVSISSTGLITASDNAGGLVQIGQLQIYGFVNERGLEQVGGGFFTENLTSGDGQANTPGDVGFGTLSQYQLELSNVEIATEFASFMAAQQAYDMSSKMLKAIDEMLKELTKS